MRMLVTGLLFFFVAVPALAGAPQGDWKVTEPSQPNYIGLVTIDAERRVTWFSPDDGGRPARFQGYISALDGEITEFKLTDGVSVARVICSIQSDELFHCIVRNGNTSAKFSLVKVGPGPKRAPPVH